MRGGTSRGLFFSGVSLAPFRQEHRDKIICSAMGSPDPGGRQIDGLGGGVSSLSKCAIVSTPGGGMAGIANKAGIPMPGSSAGDHKRLYNDPEEGWDVNYRFGQVPVNGTQVDWGSTCGNLVAAVSQFAIASRAFSQEKITERFVSSEAEVDLEHPTPEFILPMQIFAANVEKRILVKVPVIGERLDQGWNWSPKRSGESCLPFPWSMTFLHESRGLTPLNTLPCRRCFDRRSPWDGCSHSDRDSSGNDSPTPNW